MDIRDDQNHVFNKTVAKRLGFYQMLDPETTKYRGKNVYRIVMVLILLYVCVFGVILLLSSVYYWTQNMLLSVDYFWKAISSFIMSYAIWIILLHSNDVWNDLSITCNCFTRHILRDRHILDCWRERSVLLTTTLTVFYFSSMGIFLFSSLALSNDILQVKNHDGSINNYRNSIYNLYIFASEDTYNAHYKLFYIVEVSCLISLVSLFVVFDFFLVTFIFTISCQMEMVCTAFESVGHKSFGDRLSLIDSKDKNKKLINEHDLLYDELKTIIMDHQVVMKKYYRFLTIFERNLLLQIVCVSLSFIILFFCFIMSFSNEERFQSSRIFSMNIFSVIPPDLTKLFGMCYLFGKMHNQKDSIIFALYSCNWTEMDMKCKQLILLTMQMNNANHKKLKFTGTKIVNLEMFFKTMRDSYSILSVLINHIKNTSE